MQLPVANISKDIIQSGTLVLWTMAGCLDRFPKVYNSRYFSEIICLALVTDEDSLRQRMQEGRGITDENWINSSCDYNRYFMEHTQVGDTKYELLDISMKSPKEVADDVINWVVGFFMEEKEYRISRFDCCLKFTVGHWSVRIKKRI